MEITTEQHFYAVIRSGSKQPYFKEKFERGV